MKEELKKLIAFAKSFGENEEECSGNLQHIYDVLYNGAEQEDNLFAPVQEKSEYAICRIYLAMDFAYDEKLKNAIDAFIKKFF